MLPKLLTETQAYEAFGAFLQDKELRTARTEGRIGFYRFKNRIHYREDELVAYLNDRLAKDYTPPESP